MKESKACRADGAWRVGRMAKCVQSKRCVVGNAVNEKTKEEEKRGKRQHAIPLLRPLVSARCNTSLPGALLMVCIERVAGGVQ